MTTWSPKRGGNVLPKSLFFKLTQHKQYVIFQQSLNEFSKYGYDATSTNQIVKKTGISKGSLFKYFLNKEDLFFYVCSKSVDLLVNHIELSDDPNFFSNIKHMLMRELAFYQEYPEIFQLFLKIQSNTSHPVYQQVLEDYEKMAEEILDGVFQYLPHGDKPIEQTKTFVIWVLEGMKKQMLKKTQSENVSIDNLENEIDQYLDFLRKCLG